MKLAVAIGVKGVEMSVEKCRPRARTTDLEAGADLGIPWLTVDRLDSKRSRFGITMATKRKKRKINSLHGKVEMIF